MAETSILTYCAIREAAARLQTEGDKINDCIDKMRAIIYELPEIWKTDTCDGYVDQYLELEPKMKEMATLITDMAAQMNQISADFLDRNSNIAG